MVAFSFFSSSRDAYRARNPLLGARLMFVVAALLFTFNSSMAADPSCASDKPDECFLPGPDFDVKSIYPDGDVTIDDDRVNIELKGTQKLKWPSVKVLAPKKLSITVTAELKAANDEFTYSIGNLRFVFMLSNIGGKAEWSVKLECTSSSDTTIPPDGYWTNPAVTVELSAGDEVKASYQGKAGEVSGTMNCPSLYADDVVLINPKAGEIKGTGASVTMELKDAKIMLSKGLGPTTAAPRTTGNGPCVNGTCESFTCKNGTSVNSTCVNDACETVTCVNVTCENGTSVNSTCVNGTCGNGTCETVTCVNGTCGNGTNPTPPNVAGPQYGIHWTTLGVITVLAFIVHH